MRPFLTKLVVYVVTLPGSFVAAYLVGSATESVPLMLVAYFAWLFGVGSLLYGLFFELLDWTDPRPAVSKDEWKWFVARERRNNRL